MLQTNLVCKQIISIYRRDLRTLCLKMNCILCMNATSETIEIFGLSGKSLNIPEIISRHFWFLVDECNENHREICVDCWQQTLLFNQFYDRVRDVHLKNAAKNAVLLDQPFESQFLSKRPEDYLNVAIKSEAIAEGHQTENVDLIPHHSVKCESISPSDGSPWQQVESTTAQENEDINDDNKDEVFDDRDDNIDDGTDTEPNQNDESEVERKMADYFRMNCDLCSEKFESMADIQQHFKNKHNIIRGYLRCCDCSNRKFNMRRPIVDHVTWHCNPNAFKCTKCPRTFTEMSRLVTHTTTHHVEDEKLIFNCHLCEKRFSKRGKLNEHLKGVHPPDDQSFTCDLCQKEYKTKKLLHNHKKTVHDPDKYIKHICFICARVLHSKHTLKEHLRTHDDGAERFKCDECGTMLKSQTSLLHHKRVHTDEKQTCSICFKVKPNRSALSNHMRNVHSEGKHKCTYCEKVFRRLMSLKEHIATHTGEALYNCKFCPTTFKSNSNMFKHHKQVHPEEWKAAKKMEK